jgi:hypothetical protein
VETRPNAEVHSAIRLLHVKSVAIVQICHQLEEEFTAHCCVNETRVDGKGAKFLIIAGQMFYDKQRLGCTNTSTMDDCV